MNRDSKVMSQKKATAVEKKKQQERKYQKAKDVKRAFVMWASLSKENMNDPYQLWMMMYGYIVIWVNQYDWLLSVSPLPPKRNNPKVMKYFSYWAGCYIKHLTIWRYKKILAWWILFTKWRNASSKRIVFILMVLLWQGDTWFVELVARFTRCWDN